MGRLERKLERKADPKPSKKGIAFSRIIVRQKLGRFHEYRLHATKGWRVKKVSYLVNPNIILRKANVEA